MNEQSPNIFPQDIPPASEKAIGQNEAMKSLAESELIKQLMELTTPEENPWRADYEQTIRECYDFKELRQWEGNDIAMLLNDDTPALSIDRIDRSLTTIRGIRENTGNRKKVIPRESTNPSDIALADILDRACEYFNYHGDFDDAFDDAFDTMLDIGIGIVKRGWDSRARGGEGEFWTESCDIESMGWSKTRDKKFKNLRWIFQKHTMAWEDVMKMAPEKAAELRTMATLIADDWEKKKGSGIDSVLTRDYSQASIRQDNIYSYPGKLNLWEFYVLRTIPLKKVAKMVQVPMESPQMPFPGMPNIPQMQNVIQTRLEPMEYEAGEGEETIDIYHDEWWIYKIAGSGDTNNRILLEGQLFGDSHPYSPVVAEFKKSGQPRGFIEIVIPHQKRINIAWSQKTGFNNKSLKSPLIIHDGDIKDNNIDHALQASQIGSVLVLSKNAKEPIFNLVPQINLQAIEEGNVAREDMDFTASASEPVLRGQVGYAKSGVQTSMLQSAAMTPLTKWVKAESGCKLHFWRNMLKDIIDKIKEDRLRRIVGEDFFDSLTKPQPVLDPMGQPTMDPATGMPAMRPPIVQLPLNLDIADFDIVIQDQALTDFNKQQSFNALEALVAGGVLMDDEFRIRNAPLKDTDGALASNAKQKNDQMRMMMVQMQMMQMQIQELSKGQGGGGGGGGPRGNRGAGNQRRNAQNGKNAPQNGKRSMMGGQTY